MYPHIITAFNIERGPLIAKILIDGFNTEQYDHLFVNNEIMSNVIDDDDDDEESEDEIDSSYDASKDFVDNYTTGDVLSIGTKWFNLPSFDKIEEDFKKKFKIKKKKRLQFRKTDYFAEPIEIE